AHATGGPGGAVRGTMGRPQLPKRRAQEHLVPELRDPPAGPAPDNGHLVGHDPGLMAAFQRGIGLAEAHGDPDHDSEHNGGPDRHRDLDHDDNSRREGRSPAG
ncbi:ATP-binding protein, partial [Streptomyces sp. T-3]|nr:ATP-binding protein [Streptomyces sp. T-3]